MLEEKNKKDMLINSPSNQQKQVTKKHIGSLKPKRPTFIQKPIRKITGRGR